jgi:4-alpha-glucanotransferase
VTDTGALRALARLYHVQGAYTDIFGRRRVATPDSLLRVLHSLGAPLSDVSDAPEALRAREAALAAEAVSPVVVITAGRRPVITIRPNRAQKVEVELIREDGGGAQRWTVPGTRARRSTTVALPGPLAPGYHQLHVVQGAARSQATVIVAPVRAYSPPGPEKAWGVFLPLYALRTAADWGAGNFSGLRALGEWAGTLGGSVVATLPLLPVFLDRPFDPSPYAPVSRRFWNEFYVDVERVPELGDAPRAQALIASPGFQRGLRRQRRDRLVDYQGQMQQQRTALEALADAFFRHAASARRDAFERFTRAHPAASDYAAFRAVMERQGRSWTTWPARAREGRLRGTDYDERVKRYHLYAQWIAQEQFTAAGRALRSSGGMVYVDLPLGVHTWGYDAWRDRDVFAAGVSTGAPPDTFFGQGQNWGSPPLHPQRLRSQGYRYFIECIRHHLAHASLLRIDHVMGLHRFFWIPHGVAAADGVYVRYPAREFYAILALESVRHRAMIVGENLGTVPDYVTRAMRAHRVLQTYVVQYALRPDRAAPLQPVPNDAVAALNTHDMPPFGGFWTGRDLRDLRALGQLTAAQAASEWRRRRAMLRTLGGWLGRTRGLRAPVTARRMLRALLAVLGVGPARLVLVNLEDLWLEAEPQNTPGTADQRPNWRRKAAYTLEQIRTSPAVRRTLRELNRARTGRA